MTILLETDLFLNLFVPQIWRGVRVVEGARLESVYTGNGIAGSNPALSAVKIRKMYVYRRRYHGFCQRHPHRENATLSADNFPLTLAYQHCDKHFFELQQFSYMVVADNFYIPIFANAKNGMRAYH